MDFAVGASVTRRLGGRSHPLSVVIRYPWGIYHPLSVGNLAAVLIRYPLRISSVIR